MKELSNGWTIDNLIWDIVYDVIENGKTITKTIPLDGNQEQAKVGELCRFYIEVNNDKPIAKIKTWLRFYK